MTGNLVSPTALLLAMGVAGLGFGLIYFATLRRTAEALGAGRRRRWAVILSVGRALAAVAVFTGAAHVGAAPLLVTFAGFLLARAVVVRRVRRSA
jgi:hypothetical protein